MVDGRRVDPAERAEFIRLVQEGWTSAALSEHFHITEDAVARRVRTWGLKGLRENNRKGEWGWGVASRQLDAAVRQYWAKRKG